MPAWASQKIVDALNRQAQISLDLLEELKRVPKRKTAGEIGTLNLNRWRHKLAMAKEKAPD